mmetsp:Transcript_48042/g.118929  ORF Transcript_48042/g.118929 Transcript_48042/m.118929 type:complete len:116 (-) Transcript_48042:271-618(-)
MIAQQQHRMPGNNCNNRWRKNVDASRVTPPWLHTPARRVAILEHKPARHVPLAVPPSKSTSRSYLSNKKEDSSLLNVVSYGQHAPPANRALRATWPCVATYEVLLCVHVCHLGMN